MKRQKRTILSATALAVYLSLNVELVDDQRGTGLFTLPLLSLTGLLMFAWSIRAGIARLRSKLDTWVVRLQLTQMVVGIGWRSLAWGVGF